MTFQTYPTGNAPIYYPSSMVYYPQPSFQPFSDYSYGRVALQHQQADMFDPSFVAMHPSMVHEQHPLCYTIDANGNLVVVTAPQTLNASPTFSLNQSNASSNESFHRASIASTSDGTIASQPSEVKSSRSGKRSDGTSGGGMSRKSGGKLRPGVSSAYKTQLCNMFSTQGTCSYGHGCQYAHGAEELRIMTPHPKYKTQLCNKFNSAGGCQYGEKCHFRHPTDATAAATTATANVNNKSG